jgi:hypothetical protein
MLCMGKDTTQARRQAKRVAALNEAAAAVGYSSWSSLETAVIHRQYKLSQRRGARGVKPRSPFKVTTEKNKVIIEV